MQLDTLTHTHTPDVTVVLTIPIDHLALLRISKSLQHVHKSAKQKRDPLCHLPPFDQNSQSNLPRISSCAGYE